MKNTLYLECNSGISGDMLVAALLDLGADQEVLRAALDSIPAKGFTYHISRVKKAGVDCCDFSVELDAEHENHDHDMEYLHGNAHHHEHGHHHHHHEEVPAHGMVKMCPHAEEHIHEDVHELDMQYAHEHMHGHCHHHHEEHCHEHEHSHNHVPHEIHHHHEHRGLKEIIAILNATEMTDNARALALKIFDIIATAEAKAHAVAKEEVHFHEVGAIDSIVDVTAIAVCADNLNIGETIIPKLCEGTGTVRCQHGVLPVPVPAVVNVLQAYGFNLEIIPVEGEFVTPTGIAAAAALCTGMELPAQFKIKAIGLGAGKRTYERPSILRAMLIEPTQKKTPEIEATADEIVQLEANIDDCSGEALGYALECLLAAGALDAHYLPCYMKKNRPAYQLQVLCYEQDREALEKIIFTETTTIGLRRSVKERTVLPRAQVKVATELGEVQAKLCSIDGVQRIYPEYEDCAKIAKSKGIPLAEVYAVVKNAEKTSK